MAYRLEKEENGEYAIVIDGFENGIARSPHLGIANMQGVNISTETNEVMCSFTRTLQSQSGTAVASHTLTPESGSPNSHFSSSFAITNGVWIDVTASTITGLSTGRYYIQNSDGLGTSFQLSTYYGSSVLGGFGTTGSATYTLWRAVGQPIASATEPYSNGTQQYRYYILDSAGLVWCYDTAVVSSGVTGSIYWFLPDFQQLTGATGIAVLNGWLHVFQGINIWCKPTVNLGDKTSTTSNFVIFAPGYMVSSQTHFAYAGHQGLLYYTDGNFIGGIFPDTTILNGTSNIQSYASYTAATTAGTISTLIGGSIPFNGTDNSIRIPAVFFSSLTASHANPAAVAIGTIFYIKYLPSTSGYTDNSTFEVYAAATGGSALDIQTGAVGTQYFATYYPTSAGGAATISFTPERLNLPFFENATSLTEIGNNLLIGTKSNAIYPWNQVSVKPADLITLPENNTSFLLTVNNMAYIFAGSKGNIYVSNGSAASLTLSVPDYCAGIEGSVQTYVEPYFTWGGAMYLRGRVYFSILDQTSAKAGNCGGVWSFVPSQNFSYGQDTGLALRMENQNSYATYSGVATVLLANQNQLGLGPQYWSGWYSSISSPTYGIDVTGTTPQTAIIETDEIPTGTLLKKKTFSQVEYKLATPLVAGDAVSMKYRLNRSSAFTTCGTVKVESTTDISGYFTVNFQNTQWVQLQATLTPISSASSSFIPLKEIRIR